MKGRLIGALWIIAALLAAYMIDGGRYFFLLIWFCMAMAYGEIYAVSDINPWRMRPYMDKLKYVHVVEGAILAAAVIAAWFLSRDEFVMVIMVCVLSDVGAFAVGKLFGKHKVAALKQISPNKTYEGYIGGVIFPLMAIILAPAIFGVYLNGSLIVFAFCGGLVAEIGDLLGSATKRRLGMKDSNEELMNYKFWRILEYPLKGHGGYLDRVDSLALGLVAYGIIKVVASLL